MSDYKNTLNLPRTDFPMKANLSQREPQLLKKWQDMSLYSRLREERQGCPPFTLHMGPPYANGHIHMGTALTTTLKDIIVKSKSMSGFNAPLVPGWDCHGLPIELNVEKKIGKAGIKVEPAAFRQACREYAQGFIDIQREEFKRLGIQADWDNPYLTMNFTYEANIIRSLAKMIENGHLEKGYKPVHWCLDCASALAEAEVEYADKTSSSIDVAFKAVDIADVMARFSQTHLLPTILSIPIWTTTPWTLPANQAVAVNPDLDYVLMDIPEIGHVIVAEALAESVLKRWDVIEHTVLETIPGKKLEGVQLQHPFYDRVVPVILGDHVTTESGTGAVHTAPAHGQEDYVVGKKYNLPVENPVGDDGCYTKSTLIFAGKHVNKVNDEIIELLKTQNCLLHSQKITHSYPHCWRHKTPLIFRSTPQWFISMDKNHLRDDALQAIERVQWVPEWGQSRIAKMVESRPDWCISRQRTWGVPIPLFVNKETGELHPNTLALMEDVAKRVEQSGVDAWFSLDAKELLGNEANHYTKINDILDVWFDSGVSHECVLRQRPELQFPADLYLEGSDQHRGWFQSSLLTSEAINQQEPFKAVLTHGYVVDGQGRKMSKSLGNVMAPEKVVQSLGADVLRLWVASVDYRTEINVSDEILSRNSETYRRIRNTARFLLANLDGFDPAIHLLPAEKMLALDRWAVDMTLHLQEEIQDAYSTYQFHLIYQKIHHFCAVDMGSFYLDIIKDRQYTVSENNIARRSAQSALYHMIEAMVRWIAPILSFTADEIWQFIPGQRDDSVFLTTWYKGLASNTVDSTMDAAYWQKIRSVRDAVNKEIEKQRNNGVIGSPLEAHVTLYCQADLKQQLDKLKNELRFVLITSGAETAMYDSQVTDVVETDLPDLWLKVTPLTDTKCERCWHRRVDVGTHADHPTLCDRCIENIDGSGEVRQFA